MPIKAILKKYVVAISLAALSIVLAAIALLVFFLPAQSIMRDGATTYGVVTALNTGAKGTYYPVVKFTTESGETIEDRTGFGSNPPVFHKGDRVEVHYMRDNPKKWIVNSWGELYFGATIFGSFSVILAIAATIVTHCLRKGPPIPGTVRPDHKPGWRKR